MLFRSIHFIDGNLFSEQQEQEQQQQQQQQDYDPYNIHVNSLGSNNLVNSLSSYNYVNSLGTHKWREWELARRAVIYGIVILLTFFIPVIDVN